MTQIAVKLPDGLVREMAEATRMATQAIGDEPWEKWW